jgi:dipeptidyl-peptidase III
MPSATTFAGPLASTMEECRAEAVGLVLCPQPEVLRIFGHADAAEAEEIVYANWLNMARAGLLALQYYTPAAKAWGQAHMQARHALLRVMLEAGGGLAEVVSAEAPTTEGEGGVHVRLDRSLIATIGVPAVSAFLHRLQVRGGG